MIDFVMQATLLTMIIDKLAHDKQLRLQIQAFLPSCITWFQETVQRFTDDTEHADRRDIICAKHMTPYLKLICKSAQPAMSANTVAITVAITVASGSCCIDNTSHADRRDIIFAQHITPCLKLVCKLC